MRGMFTLRKPILVLLGKSGAGKDKIQDNLMGKFGFDRITSHTSRPMREGESSGNPYYFVDRNVMIDFYNSHDLLELREYHTTVDDSPETWYYGIHLDEVERNMTGERIVVVDPQGLSDLVHIFGEHQIVSVYIDVSDGVRTERARGRGSYDEAEWKRRMSDDNRVFADIREKVDLVLDNSPDLASDDLTIENAIYDFYSFKETLAGKMARCL